MKRFTILSLVVSLLASMFVFSSCTDPEDQPETTGTETEPQESVSENVTEPDTEPDTEPTAQLPAPFETVVRDTYTITSENGKAVVRFTGKEIPPTNNCLPLAGMPFSSVENYRDKLFDGTFSDGDLELIKFWETKYETEVRLPDPNNIIGLQLPEGWTSGGFNVGEDGYWYSVSSEYGSGSISIMYNEAITYEMLIDRVQQEYHNEKYHEEGYEDKACTYLGADGVSLEFDTYTATLREITADMTNVLGTGDKQYVGVKYLLDASHSYATPSEDIPMYMSYVGMTENGTLYEVIWYPKQAPTLDLHEILRPEK